MAKTTNEEKLAGIMANADSVTKAWKGHSVDKLSISIGYAAHREFPDMTIEELGRTADQKMYEAKQTYYRNHDRRRV